MAPELMHDIRPDDFSRRRIFLYSTDVCHFDKLMVDGIRPSEMIDWIPGFPKARIGTTITPITNTAITDYLSHLYISHSVDIMDDPGMSPVLLQIEFPVVKGEMLGGMVLLHKYHATYDSGFIYDDEAYLKGHPGTYLSHLPAEFITEAHLLWIKESKMYLGRDYSSSRVKKYYMEGR